MNYKYYSNMCMLEFVEFGEVLIYVTVMCQTFSERGTEKKKQMENQV